MSVEQSYIDGVLVNVRSAANIIANRYVVNSLNGIYNKSQLVDLIKLNGLKRELEDLDLENTDVYTDEYIYNLERETRQYCTKLKKPVVADLCEEGSGGGEEPIVSSEFQKRYYFSPSSTSGNFASTGIIVPLLPRSLVIVTILTGLSLAVGDGIRTRECYFSDDSGATAKALDDIQVGDELYYNGTVMGVNLAGTETIELLII